MLGDASLTEKSKGNWSSVESAVAGLSQSSRRSMHAMTDSRPSWPIVNMRKTDSNHCDYKYWVWRPFSAKPRCALRNGGLCIEDECPQKM